MKCKKCGYRTNTLNAMRKHYLKKHPSAMKHRKSSEKASVRTQKGSSIRRLINEIEAKLESLEDKI